jgi:hypothetical protein
MTDRDTTTRTRARAPGVGGVFHRMAVHDRVLRPDSERTTVATTKCTKGGCKLDGGRRMPGAGLSRRSPRKAPLGQSAFQPYWGKLAVRNDRGDRGNVGIIRSPIRASILPDQLRHPTAWACAEKLLTLGLRASGADQKCSDSSSSRSLTLRSAPSPKPPVDELKLPYKAKIRGERLDFVVAQAAGNQRHRRAWSRMVSLAPFLEPPL